ncbi:MAG: HAMP domain-containing protein [Melioribacteraceae bacterium]|nr:HAMP domain-containing protein [Melioribacteraceae bacterium]MCF8264120.1 HAMP domain-containing protein [Melioribacteraceae bacterium]MCF8412045.1 HAMP domain-containing protein [Melioribacteraceae bacterium]
MPKLSLKVKIILLSVLLAIIPLGVAGDRMITITQDELKSAANDELRVTASQLSKEIDDLYIDTWRAPLLLIKNAIDDENLGVAEKVSLLTSTKEVVDIIAIQLTVEGLSEPVIIMQDSIKNLIENAGLNALNVLKKDTKQIAEYFGKSNDSIGKLNFITEADLWVISLIIPLENKIQGRSAVLSAIINLNRLKERIVNHPFTKTGEISLVDRNGRKIFDKDRVELMDYQIVNTAVNILESGSRPIGIEPYIRPDGTAMLGSYSFPVYFDWAVISERTEADAYLAVAEMFNSLILWVVIGLTLAILGAFLLSQRISKPILMIGRVAEKVGTGDFNIRVGEIKSKDEIKDLGDRMNGMIEGLRERFELQKFVSGSTMDAIKIAKEGGMKLGGERRNATVFFSDIRGFTAFSEKVEPEVVIEMLNTYLRHQANIVKKYHGDIDKYVGDELVAVFKDDDMVENAMRAAVEIQKKIAELNEDKPEWKIGVGIGINTGDMVMGAMGSEDRMDFTILGDNVNLGARLCSAAKSYQTIISQNSYDQIKNINHFTIEKLVPIPVKGKEKPIQVYSVIDIKD